MSTTYHIVAAGPVTRRRPGALLGLSAALTAVIGIGAVPAGLLSVTTAEWTRPARAARPLALSAVALIRAFGLLFYFERA